MYSGNQPFIKSINMYNSGIHVLYQQMCKIPTTASTPVLPAVEPNAPLRSGVYAVRAHTQRSAPIFHVSHDMRNTTLQCVPSHTKLFFARIAACVEKCVCKPVQNDGSNVLYFTEMCCGAAFSAERKGKEIFFRKTSSYER